MKTETIVIGILCFALGVLSAVTVPKYFSPEEVDITNRVQAPPPSASPAPSATLTAAVKRLESLVKNDPDNVEIRLQLGNAYFDSGAFGEAIKQYEKYLAKNPDNSDARTDLGICYRNIGDFLRAVDEFEKAADANPAHINSRFNAGIVSYYDLKDFLRAKKNWEIYLKNAPNDRRLADVKSKLTEINSVLAGK